MPSRTGPCATGASWEAPVERTHAALLAHVNHRGCPPCAASRTARPARAFPVLGVVWVVTPVRERRRRAFSPGTDWSFRVDIRLAVFLLVLGFIASVIVGFMTYARSSSAS